jgi:hypothetical protein
MAPFDPSQFGATPVISQSGGSFDPTQFGATPVNSNADTTDNNYIDNSAPAPQPPSAGSVLKGIGNFLFPIVGDVANDITGKNNKTLLQQGADLGLSALPFVPGLGEVGEGVRGAGAVAEGAADLGANAALEGGTAATTGAADQAPSIFSRATASPVGRGAIAGYGTGVLSNLSQGKSIGSSFQLNPTNVISSVIGGGVPLAISGLNSFSTKLSGIDPQILNALKDGSIAPQDYDAYMAAAKARAGNIRALSPLNLAADQVDNAANNISRQVDEAGQVVGTAKKMGATIPLDQTGVTNAAQNFMQQVQDRFGLNLNSDENGIVTATQVPGSMRKVAPSDVSRIEDMATQMNKLFANGEPSTVKNATDIISNFNDLVDHSKDDVYGHTNDPLEGLIKNTAGNINQAVRTSSPQIAAANDRFSTLKGLQDEISGMAGKNLQKGELLMRRVFSGDQSGPVQDLFGKIKSATGIDLVNHAVLAKHAIETVGDNSQKTMLENMLQEAGPSNTVLGKILGVGKNIAKSVLANPERIGRNAVQGTKSIIPSLLTKAGLEASRGLTNQ